MRIRGVLSAAAAATLAAALTAAPAGADHRHHLGKHFFGPHLVTLDPSTHGNPEGVTWHRRSKSYFVGATGDGTIYRGWLGRKKLRPFITVNPSAGRAAIGMQAVGNKLYVAGGPTGKLFVYRISTRELIGTFDTGPGGFLNDLTVTARGHVYITDSFRPVLWRVSPAKIRAGSGTPAAIDVSPEITYLAGQFNLNGIVWAGHGEFLTIQSATGLIYRIKLDQGAPGGRTIAQLAAPPVTGGDGMIWDRGRLVIVDGDPASLTFMALSTDLTEAFITKVRTSPLLRGPSTVARAWNRYLVVNADFSTSTTPFTVASLWAPRRHPVWELPDGGDGWLAGDLRARH
jgi:Cu-Zn family superoxide dismutase